MKNKELTIDDMLLCRDMIGLVLGDSDLSKGFRQCLHTNNPKLERLQNKLDGLAKTQLNGGTPPSTDNDEPCSYCGADLPGDNGDCGKCGL
jgi:hypothetical protein